MYRASIQKNIQAHKPSPDTWLPSKPSPAPSSVMQLNKGQIHPEKKCWCTWVTLIQLFFFFFFHVIWSMLLTHKSLKRQIYPRALEHLGGKKHTEEMLAKAQGYCFRPPGVGHHFWGTTRAPELAELLSSPKPPLRSQALNADGCIWLEFWCRLISGIHRYSLQKRKTSLLYL